MTLKKADLWWMGNFLALPSCMEDFPVGVAPATLLACLLDSHVCISKGLCVISQEDSHATSTKGTGGRWLTKDKQSPRQTRKSNSAPPFSILSLPQRNSLFGTSIAIMAWGRSAPKPPPTTSALRYFPTLLLCAPD